MSTREIISLHDDDLYSGFNEYSSIFDTTNFKTKDRIGSQISSEYDISSTLNYTGKISSSLNNLLPARPLTAVRGMGYSSQWRGSTAEVLKHSSKLQTSPRHSSKELTIESKVKELEKGVTELINESCLAENVGDFKTALEKAKSASSKEHNLIRLLEQTAHDDTHDFELTFSVLFTVAHQYVTNEMYTEALNMYHAITKNKVFQNGFRVKVNMGNIYAQLGDYQKAIKMYKWALDHVPNTNKDLRVKIVHNIAIIFINMKQFDEACANFEYIMHEKPDFKAGFHVLLCYYIMGNKDMLKKSFEVLLSIPYTAAVINDSSHDSTLSDILMETILRDDLSNYEKLHQQDIEKSIVIAANLVSRTVEDTYSAGYSWSVEAIKNSPYSILVGDLEINKAVTYLRNNDIVLAIDALKYFDKKENRFISMATTNLSFIYNLQGEMEKAETTATTALQCDIYNPMANVNAGNCAFNQGDLVKAVELYAQAIENDSSCVEALYNLGLVNKRLNNLDESLDCFLKLQTIIPNQSEVLYQIAHLHEIMGEINDAIEWYIQLLGIMPTDAGVLQKLGELHDNDHDKQQAFHYYFESYRHYPSNLSILDWLGAYFIELRLAEKAIIYFEKASLIQPNEPKWRLLIGSCHRRTGNYQSALEIYKSVHAEHPDNLDCLKLLIRLADELGLKDASMYSEKLKHAEKVKQMQQRMGSSGSSGIRRASASGSARGKNGSSHSSSSSPLLTATSVATDNLNDSMHPKNIDAAYSDPLGPVVNRPRTSAKKSQTIIDDQFADDDIGEDLLPE